MKVTASHVLLTIKIYHHLGCPDALYPEHNMAARPRPNMNSNNMKYTNTASPNRNNTNGHGKPRLSNGPKSPMNPSFSNAGHSGSRPQDQFQASSQGKKSKEIVLNLTNSERHIVS